MIQDTNDRNRQHPLARAAEVFLFWIPVLVPLILLGQLGTQGLRPALVKADKLEEDERGLDEQLWKNELRGRELKAKFDALTDPIYRHRNELRLREKARAVQPSPEPDAVPARNF